MVMRQIFQEQYTKLPVLITPATCTRRTYIVTGSNNGLGLETARHLVRCEAACVILAVRNTTAGETAKMDIERTTGRKFVVEVWHLDLASSKSVKDFVKRAQGLKRIDGLIENAGVMLDTWTEVEGMETTMNVNVVNTMQLAMLMMPKLIESAKTLGIQPRVVFVVSGLGFLPQTRAELLKAGTENIFSRLNDEKKQDMDQRYALSKLVEMYAVRAFAAAYPVDQTNVIINMVSPGICQTGLARDTRVFMRAAQGVIRAIFARTAEEGSRTILHGLVEDVSSHGKHLSGCKVKDDWIQPWMVDAGGQHIQEQIWVELLAVV